MLLFPTDTPCPMPVVEREEWKRLWRRTTDGYVVRFGELSDWEKRVWLMGMRAVEGNDALD